MSVEKEGSVNSCYASAMQVLIWSLENTGLQLAQRLIFFCRRIFVFK